MNIHNVVSVERVTGVDDDFISQINKLLDKGAVWDTKQGNKFLSNRDNALFVAKVDNKITGFVTAHRLQRFDKRQAEVLLYEITVDESYREKGIGKALIENVKQWAKKVGADEVWVLTNTSNKPAMALYSSTGGKEDKPDTTMFTFKLE